MGQGCCRTASVYPERDAQYVRKDSLTSFGDAGTRDAAAATAAGDGGRRHDSVGLSLKQADAAPMVLLTPPHTLQQQQQQQQQQEQQQAQAQQQQHQQQQQQQQQQHQYPPLPVQKPAEQVSEKKREPAERVAEAPPLLPPLPPASVPPVRKDSAVHLANASSVSSSYVSTAKQSSRSSAAASKHTDDQAAAAAAAAAGNNGQPTTTTSNTRSPQVQTIGGRLYNEEQEIPKTVSIYHQTNVPSEMDTVSKHSEELPRPISFTGVSQVNRAPSWSMADTAHAPPSSPPPPPPPPQSVEEPSLGTVRTVPQDSSAIGNDSAEAMMAEYPPVPTQPSSSASGSGGHASPASGPNQTIASASANTVLGAAAAAQTPPAEAPAAAEPPTPTPTAPPASALLSDSAVPSCGSGSGTVICNRVTESVDQKGRRRVNGYTLTKHLGSGRYGDVYLAEAGEKNNKRLYALKEVSRKLFGGGGGGGGGKAGGGEAKNKGKDGSTLSKEVLVLMLINHPNVVKLFEVLDDESMKQQYLVLEYVDGGPIMTLNEKGVAAESPFPEDVTRNYFQQTVEGLAYLHNHNIIHKDIKPENLLVTRDRTTVKLADFGVSRLMASEDDGSRDTSGTPLFLSPETCRGDFSSGKSNDIWALGVTLYIFMYGRTPFAAAKTEILLYQRIQDDEILYPSKPRYSRDLRGLIRRLLERNVLLRITLNEIRNNAWVRGSCELLPEEEIEQIQSSKAQSAAGPGGAAGARGGAERRTVTPIHMVDSRTAAGRENDINILIVEDVFLVKKLTERMVLKYLDSARKVNVSMVSDGADAVEACKETRFHLVFMDVHMSHVSGVSATWQINEYEQKNRLAPTNIVGLTADPAADMDALCIEAGMHEVIQKPLKPDVLRELLERFQLPTNPDTGNTTFDAADFKKGEVRGGGANHAYLKSYQEHITRTSTDGDREKDAAAGGEGGDRHPDSGLSRGVSTHTHTSDTSGASGASSDKFSHRMSAATQPNSTYTNYLGGQATLSREGSSSSVTSTHEGGMSDPSDMRNRSLHCMKTHQNMYKGSKKSCDKKFMYVSEEDFPIAKYAAMQVVVEQTDHAVLNALTPDDMRDLHDVWNDEFERWVFELQAIHGYIPLEELSLKLLHSDVWTEIREKKEALNRGTPGGYAPPPPPPLPVSRGGGGGGGGGCGVQVFAFEEKGNRRSMEDTFAVLPYPTVFEDARDVDGAEVVVGVFDGHGGKYAAEYCRHYMMGKLLRSPLYRTDLPAALRHSYADCNKGFFKKVEGVDCDAGTTAVMAVVRGGTLTVANVGDCRLVVGGATADGAPTVSQLTNLHVCTDEGERTAVEQRGGSVIHYMGNWRVNGVLLVTRSIGDMPCRDFVTCEPDIHTYHLSRRDRFAVLASDGLWDVVSPEEVCEQVAASITEIDEARLAMLEGGDGEEDEESELSASSSGSGGGGGAGGDQEEAAQISYAMIPEALASYALEKGSTDNITCAIIFFQWPEDAEDT
eukprot:Rhum_TRINITY_DN10782_c0_g2::Rhum_TRINITY_DN10782_c0_g2_i1::g.40306::m.40306